VGGMVNYLIIKVAELLKAIPGTYGQNSEK